eukprot:99118-Hanusia_phi.AAC.2
MGRMTDEEKAKEKMREKERRRRGRRGRRRRRSYWDPHTAPDEEQDVNGGGKIRAGGGREDRAGQQLQGPVLRCGRQDRASFDLD